MDAAMLFTVEISTPQPAADRFGRMRVAILVMHGADDRPDPSESVEVTMPRATGTRTAPMMDRWEPQ